MERLNSLTPPSSATFEYVDNPAALGELVKKVKTSERVALDTEANSLYEYFQKVCLIQLTIRENNYILDPLAPLDVGPFLDVIAGKPLIFHAGDYDLRMLRKTYGFSPRREVFDTMIAAQLLGCERLGLVTVAEDYLNVSLTKTGQKSNWARRPLSEEQLRYATHDTHYLENLADRLEHELEKEGRREWHRQSCKRMVDATAQDNGKPAADPWRIRGAGRLTRRQLAYLRAFWKWRDEEARKMNRPPFKVLGNHQLFELTLWADGHREQPLARGPKLPRHCKGSRLAALERALESARALPESKWPSLREKRRTADNHSAQSDTLKAACARLAKELRLPPSVLAPHMAIVAVTRARAHTISEIMECANLTRWQANLLKPVIHDVLEGGTGQKGGAGGESN